MKKVMKMLLVLGVLFASSWAYADNPSNWNFTLETTGDDVSWVSTTQVNPAYLAYDFTYDISQFDVELAGIGYLDYTDADVRARDGATYDGLSMGIVSNVYDSNGLTANFDIWVDEDGYAHVSLKDILFSQWGGVDVIGTRISGSISVKGLTELWSDDFSGYGTDGLLDDTPNWTNANRIFKVGNVYGNTAFYNNGYWMDYPGIATVDTIDSLYDPQHFKVKVEARKYETTDPLVACQWYVMARVSEFGHIRVKAALDNNTGKDLLYLRILDTDGFDSLDYYVADYDPASPIIMEVNVDGNNVVGRITHAGSSTSVSYVTTITQLGDPGIAAENQWGYAVGYFDNFSVYSTEPIAPTICGDQGTIYLKADLNQDCRVDFLDFAELAQHWMEDANPQ